MQRRRLLPGHFNPRPLHRGRRQRTRQSCWIWYFNPRPLRRGRLLPAWNDPHSLHISIHTPYAGGDADFSRCKFNQQISIHAPYAGGDFIEELFSRYVSISIHAPYAGGDCVIMACLLCQHHFNPRPLRRGRRQILFAGLDDVEFQSTPPTQGATQRRQ